jgi:hypothetical protein
LVRVVNPREMVAVLCALRLPWRNSGDCPSSEGCVSPIDRVIEALADFGSEPRERGRGWLASCPAHEDRHPSLVVTPTAQGNVIMHCRAGCSTADVLAQIDLEMRDLFAA